MIRTLFLPFEADTIICIPLSYNLQDDNIVWVGNRPGEFFVKSAYYVTLPIVENLERGECSTSDTRTPLWRKMWQLKIPPKVKIFTWRACMNGLQTLLNLGRRGISKDVLCPLRGKEPESTIHALFFVKIFGRFGGIGKHALLIY